MAKTSSERAPKPAPKTSSERREKSKREGIAQHWVTVQVQVPKDKQRAIIGLAANMRDDFKRNIKR